MSEFVTIEEKVSTACHATNLKDDADRGSQTDVLKALAWSKSRLGGALLRLHSEFDAIEKPRKLAHDAMVRLVLSMKSDIQDKAQNLKEREDMARREAAKWYANEKTLFLGKLKTLQGVVDQLASQCEKWGIDDARKVATVIVGYWLDQICPTCNGLKFEQIPDSPVLSDKPCKACQGTGLSAIPYGRAGDNLLTYIDDCVSRAQQSIKEKLKKYQNNA